jgi:hypothetical protein
MLAAAQGPEGLVKEGGRLNGIKAVAEIFRIESLFAEVR